MKPITQVSESVGKKYPQAANLSIGEPTGAVISGIITGKIQSRPNSRVTGYYKNYIEILVDGKNRFVRLGGQVKDMEDLIGLPNLIGYAVSGVVKSFTDDNGKEVRYIDELDASQELKNAINAFFSGQQQQQSNPNLQNLFP